MKALILFDSNFGNTAKVAEAVATELAGQAVSVAKFQEADLDGVDLLVVGSPINAWRPTGRIRNLLSELVGRMKDRWPVGMTAAAFDTRIKSWISGDAATRIAEALEKSGMLLLSEPKPFYVKDKEGPLLRGELSRAREWAAELKRMYKQKSDLRRVFAT
ncbi:flavodoxin [Patescibacteria group bacterium]|nr:flavodoxin [Patescibacteria group bacterium]